MLVSEIELEGIQDRYVQVLRSYLEHAAPHHPGRLQELFARIPEVINDIATFIYILLQIKINMSMSMSMSVDTTY